MVTGEIIQIRNSCHCSSNGSLAEVTDQNDAISSTITVRIKIGQFQHSMKDLHLFRNNLCTMTCKNYFSYKIFFYKSIYINYGYKSSSKDFLYASYKFIVLSQLVHLHETNA